MAKGKKSAYLSRKELELLPICSIGKNVLISRKASIYCCKKSAIGDNVRIDDFCILSGKVILGDNIHIAPYTSLTGGTAGISIKDFANLSRKVEVFAVSDDFSGQSMTNPTIPDKFKNLDERPVKIGRHVIVGANTVILPGVTLAKGTAVGALSIVKKNTKRWSIYAGAPAKLIRERHRDLLKIEKIFFEESKQSNLNEAIF